MFARTILATICLTVIFLVGCGGSDPAPDASGEGGDQPAAQPATGDQPTAEDQAAAQLKAEQAKARTATRAFIDAARHGKAEQLLGMMTTTARSVLEKNKDYMIPLSVGEKTKVTVGIAVPSGDSVFYVDTILAEFDARGAAKEHKMIWALRKEADQYRIGGVALEIIPGQNPVHFNFELSIEEQQKAIAAAIQARSRYDAAQAAKAAPPATGQPAGQQYAQPGVQPATYQPAGQPAYPPTAPPSPYQHQPVHQATQVPAGYTTPGGTIPR